MAASGALEEMSIFPFLIRFSVIFSLVFVCLYIFCNVLFEFQWFSQISNDDENISKQFTHVSSRLEKSGT